MVGLPTQGAPPPDLPGVSTGASLMPPTGLMDALKSRPQDASTLIDQAISSLEAAAGLDDRLRGRINAALEILRGPKGPPSNQP